MAAHESKGLQGVTTSKSSLITDGVYCPPKNPWLLVLPTAFFFFWWGLLHGPQQGPDRMKEKKPIILGKGKLLPKQKNPP